MRRIITAMAVVLLFTAACGDDSGGNVFSDALGEQAGDSGDSGDGSSDDPGDDASSDDSDGDDSSGDDSSGDGFGAGSSSDFCRFNDAINTGMDDLDPLSMGPEDIQNAFRQIADNIDQAIGMAPGEIRSEVEILANGVEGFLEVLEEYDYDFFAIPEEMQDDPRLAAVNDPRYEEAIDRVNEFCGVEDEPDTDVGDVPEPPDDSGVMDETMRDITIQAMQAAFGWDEQLASCVVDELGLDDPTGAIDPSVFEDPNAEVCGQSVAELFGG